MPFEKPDYTDITRCVQMDCYWNSGYGFCENTSENVAPELGTECPVYEED